ncbi:MAG: hypothetical protein OHK0037_27050 [Elainellaceae cyanobacterium]
MHLQPQLIHARQRLVKRLFEMVNAGGALSILRSQAGQLSQQPNLLWRLSNSLIKTEVSFIQTRSGMTIVSVESAV